MDKRVFQIEINSDVNTPEHAIFKDKWIRKLMVCNLHELGIICPGVCNRPLPKDLKGRHCSQMSRALNKGTKSIFRTLGELADLGYVKIEEIHPDDADESQTRGAIIRRYRLTEKGNEKAMEFDNEFEYKSLL